MGRNDTAASDSLRAASNRSPLGVKRPEDGLLLERIAAEAVTYRRKGRGTSYLRWRGEWDFDLVTQQVKRLLRDGLATHEEGWRMGRGAVVLTDEGQKALRLHLEDTGR